MAKILIIEDDQDLCELAKFHLEAERHAVDIVHDGADGAAMLKGNQYDLVILDWELPTLSGIEICQRVRALGKHVPILMTTGRSSLRDKEAGFDTGADDYLTKPFHVKELLLRVRALLRRPLSLTSETLKIGDLSLDRKSCLVYKGNDKINLSPTEFALLELFMRRAGEVLSADAIIIQVWPSDSEISPAAVRTYIKQLRKKIGDTAHASELIETVYGLGYRFTASS